MLGLGAVLLAGGLGAGWMVFVAKSNPQVDKATPTTPATVAAPAALSNPAPPSPSPEASPAKANKETKPPASDSLAASAPGQAAAGGELFYCYQGKAPENRLLVVDKARQRLMVLRYLGDMTLDYEYTCATGMQPGSKQNEGDERTPEGIYFTTHRYEDRKISVFGDRAIHLNYPNPFDQFESRDGNGIFIHGTDKTLKPRSSNGCVVLRNDELAIVASTIKEHHTPVVLTDQLRLPTLNERVKACSYLEQLSLPALEEAEASVGYSLDTKTGTANKPSQMKEMDDLAARLAGLGANKQQVRIHTQGTALFGLGQQWVVVVEQRISGPNRAELQVSRRFYLRGPDPLHAKLLSAHWVVEDVAQARLLASWAPPPKPAPVQVAAVRPEAAPEPQAPSARPEPVAKPQAPSARPEPVAKPQAPSARPEPVAKPQAPPARPEPAPAAKPAPAAAPMPEDQVRATLAGWIKAWQGKNMAEYITYYAPEFSGDGMNRNAWQKHKTYLSRVYKVIGVEAREVRVTVLGTKAKVVFVQHYRSDWHRDVGRKHLELVLKGGHWKITSERWEAMPGRSAQAGHTGRS
jgi:murein L,D-transpeptidase YafK